MSLSLTDTDIFTAVRAFILGVVPSTVEVVKAQAVGVPMPQGECVVMTKVSDARLSWNTHTNAATTRTINAAFEFVVQLDFYGASAHQYATEVEILAREESTHKSFPQNIKPLFCDAMQQIPLIGGEQQYIERWKLDLHVQHNPAVTVPQETANALKIGIHEIDSTFTP